MDFVSSERFATVGYLVDVRLAANSGSRLSSLRLQVDQTAPQVLGCVRVVADLGVRVKSKHFRCVSQRQRFDVLLK